jgi:hypothetical protein
MVVGAKTLYMPDDTSTMAAESMTLLLGDAFCKSQKSRNSQWQAKQKHWLCLKIVAHKIYEKGIHNHHLSRWFEVYLNGDERRIVVYD